jgi:ABC-type glycerol-3-phosphate transport system substrate-binding protein
MTGRLGTRRGFFGWGAAAGGLAAACGVVEQRGAVSAPAGQRRPVETWFVATPDDDPWGTTVTRVLNEFNAARQDYEVVISRVPDIGTKVPAVVAAGTGPDAFRGNLSQMQSYPMAGIVQPLDPFMKGDSGYRLDEFWPPVQQMSAYAGKHYGASPTMTPQGFFVNRDRLRQGGVSADRLPGTLQDWEQALHPLFEADGAGWRRIGWLPWVPNLSQAPGHYLAAFGAEWFDPKSEKVLANSTECVQVFEWLKGFGSRYGAEAIADFSSRRGANTFGRYSADGPMYDGSIAALNQGLFLYGSIKQWAPKVDFLLAPLPVARGATAGRPGMLGAPFWFISTPAREPRGGWEVLKWMTMRKETVVAKAQLDTLIPSNRSIATAKDFLDANPWAKSMIEQVVPRVKPDYVFGSAGLLNTQLQNAMTQVYQGKAGAKQALDEVVRVVQNDIDEKKRK